VLHLARERVATLAGRDGLLLDGLELEEAGDHETRRTARAKLLLDQIRQSLKDLTDTLLVELRVLSNVRDNLSLGHALCQQPYAIPPVELRDINWSLGPEVHSPSS